MLNTTGQVSRTTSAVASGNARRSDRARQRMTATTVLTTGSPVPTTDGNGSQISTTPAAARATANDTSTTHPSIRRFTGPAYRRRGSAASAHG